MQENIQENISQELGENLSYIKSIFKGASDVVYREFDAVEWKVALIYIDGMGDKLLLDNFVLESLMMPLTRIKSKEEIKNKILTVTDLKEVFSLKDALIAMLSGDTIMLIDGMQLAYVIATRAWPSRGVTEPSGETVVRGSRDGFTETIRFNTALIRRRIRDTRLKMVPQILGTRSRTDTVITYIEDIVNEEILEELKNRLDKIDIDAILDSGYVEQLVEDDGDSPFPQIQATEKPDVVAAALYEGRIAILVDNSPFALIVPATLPMFFQVPDDYYQRWMFSSAIRLLRIFAIALSLVLPALYVAVTSFHTSIIPTKLAYSIAASREGVPFPALVEAIIMEVSLALLLEATVHLPKPVGSTIGIVGGLIIGQAAVSAGIVSPIMIIIVSITVITTFIIPNYELSSAFRMIRFILILCAGVVGLYGIMLCIIIVMIHLIKLQSFGVPYLAPMVSKNKKDSKDLYIRAPIKNMILRPLFVHGGDKVRQRKK